MSIKPIQKMIIKTISDKRSMTYQYHFNSPMQLVERRLNMIIAKNPNIGKYSNMSFNNFHCINTIY